MNSSLTDRYREATIRRVWTTAISPAAERVIARRPDILGAPKDDAESWYVDASNEPHFVDVADAETALRDLWVQQGMPELAATSGDIAKLIRLFSKDRTQSADLSTKAYAMY